jgi:hypothetical protein
VNVPDNGHRRRHRVHVLEKEDGAGR